MFTIDKGKLSTFFIPNEKELEIKQLLEGYGAKSMEGTAMLYNYKNDQSYGCVVDLLRNVIFERMAFYYSYLYDENEKIDSLTAMCRFNLKLGFVTTDFLEYIFDKKNLIKMYKEYRFVDGKMYFTTNHKKGFSELITIRTKDIKVVKGKF